MATLEDLRAGASFDGLAPEGPATIIHLEWYGDSALKVIFEDASGNIGNRLVYRDEETEISEAQSGHNWSFEGDGYLLRLVSEAWRIRLAHLFDPYLAVNTALIEPLPHQITAVYGEMLPRQPLRFLLADDPGAGKTIMAGLLIRELMIRGDVVRCLVVAPGVLVEQWQDELHEKFGLEFDLLTREQIETTRSGDFLAERNLVIARLDVLARNPELQSKLEAGTDWDLVVVDEAHRMSASFFGGEVKFTKRYQLGQKLGGCTRHFLLMTATPHNGKEEDFQLFMALLDADRFEGRFRGGVHEADVSDLMRRQVKEELFRFDGTPLFPERRTETVSYTLSEAEAALYAEVTTYVKEEMNRVERFAEGNDRRRQNVGFALAILQRRLASSPAAIHESLRRRRQRLKDRFSEEQSSRTRRDTILFPDPGSSVRTLFDEEEFEEIPIGEAELAEDEFLDQATAARTIAELEAEIETLRHLEEQAATLRHAGTDAKWTELNSILDNPLMIDREGNRRKLIVFTEARDTLVYLADRIRTRLGRGEAVAVIHGGVGRKERRKVVEAFTHDKDVLVLVANDAAGEGINLQRAHLMVNYDLPWNPNRLEQRFGRIHRIGQTEVCHCWNLVAAQTREGEVYGRLLEKIDTASKALGGKVYDVLGQLFEGSPLSELLMEAIRYGERPEVRERLLKAVDEIAGRQQVVELIKRRALALRSMGTEELAQIREKMERASAQRLQPFHIQTFFLEAFQHLGGRIHRREYGRWEVTRVPGPVREHHSLSRSGPSIQERYERICFEKDFINKPTMAAWICPGHPLLDATLDLVMERYRLVLKQGAILVDEANDETEPRVLFFLEHSIQDGRMTQAGRQLVVSRRLQFLEVDAAGHVVDAGPAPYLDYRPLVDGERDYLARLLDASWFAGDLDKLIVEHAITAIVPRHLEDVREHRIPKIDKVEREVTARLKKEINYWDRRAEELKAAARSGKRTRLSADQAKTRADGLEGRLRQRKEALRREREISAQLPRVCGGALIVPARFLRVQAKEEIAVQKPNTAEGRALVEQLAMDAVMAAERGLGNEPRDVGAERLGYDIESREHGSSRLRFIEVKGRVESADSVTVTRNEILTALNKPEAFILAIVRVEKGVATPPRYVSCPFTREPDFGATSVTYKLSELLERSTCPH